MDASEAVSWFADTPIDGWNGTSWVSNIAYGDFHVYDRFITDRTFGAKKRIFLTPDDKKLDHATYPVVRTPDGKQWIILADNADIEGEVSYQNSYLMVEAAHSASVVEIQTTTRSSGQEGTPSKVLTTTSVCDMDRFSIDRSDNFDTVTYGVYKIVLPANVSISTDNELLISGVYYAVQEIAPELLAQAIRALRKA